MSSIRSLARLALTSAQLLDLIDYEREHSNSTSFEISSRAIPRIFGRSGAALKELGEETGAQVDVGRSEGSTVPVTIRGTKTAIAEAKKRLQAISKEVDDEAVVELNIERSLHVTLIGKGGQSSASAHWLSLFAIYGLAQSETSLPSAADRAMVERKAASSASLDKATMGTLSRCEDQRPSLRSSLSNSKPLLPISAIVSPTPSSCPTPSTPVSSAEEERASPS